MGENERKGVNAHEKGFCLETDEYSKKYLNDQGFVQLVNIDHKAAYNSHNCYI